MVCVPAGIRTENLWHGCSTMLTTELSRRRWWGPTGTGPGLPAWASVDLAGQAYGWVLDLGGLGRTGENGREETGADLGGPYLFFNIKFLS